MKIIIALLFITASLSPVFAAESATASGDKLVIATFSGSAGSLSGYEIGDTV